MAQNTAPIFTLVPQVSWGSADGNAGTAGPLKTANTAKDGTGTVLTVYTAGANGDFIDEIRIYPVGTNVATVLRVFINNGSSNATLANNICIAEISLPATTLIETAMQPPFILSIGKPIPANYKINVTLGTTIAAGVFVSCLGGQY